VIKDFEAGIDTLDVANIGLTGLSDVTISQSGGNTLVAANSNSFEVQLEGLITLDENDFNWA
jgi:hypothetical protein